MDRVRSAFTLMHLVKLYPFFFPRLASWKPAKILFASYSYSYSTALSCGSRTVDDLTRQLSASGKLSAGDRFIWRKAPPAQRAPLPSST